MIIKHVELATGKATMTRVSTLTGLAIIIVLALVGIARSAGTVSVKADWSYDTAAVTSQGIAGFRVKDAAGKTIADNLSPTTRTATFTTASDGKTCLSFYMTAFSKDDETGPSNILTYCPQRKPLTGIGTIQMTFTDQ